MSTQRKKDKGSPTLSRDEKLDDSIKEFADLVVESLKEGYRNDLEPFEVYAQKIRSHIHANAEEFRTRFSRGYHVLLDELKRECGDSSSKDKNSIKP